MAQGSYNYTSAYQTNRIMQCNVLTLYFVILIICSKVTHPALMDQSACKETHPLVDVWKSVTSMSGVQCVVILNGDLLMPKLHADS